MAGVRKRAFRWATLGGIVLAVAAVLLVGWKGLSRGGPLDPARSAWTSGHWREALCLANDRLRNEPNDLDARWLSARASASLRSDASTVAQDLRLGGDGATPENDFLLGDTLVRQGR